MTALLPQNMSALSNFTPPPAAINPQPDYFGAYFEACRASVHKQAEEKFPEKLDERQAWVEQALAYVEFIYRTAAEFAPQVDQLCQLCNYLSARNVYHAHPTVQ